MDEASLQVLYACLITPLIILAFLSHKGLNIRTAGQEAVLL